MSFDSDLATALSVDELIDRLAACALAKQRRIATGESLTGGAIAAALSAVAGSSAWLEGGFVTYRLSAKQRMLGVAAATLERHGAVSEPTAREMVLGVLAHCDATHAVAVTGIAGPSGGEPLLPVGSVWCAWAARGDDLVHARHFAFPGDRAAVRAATVRAALAGLLLLLDAPRGEVMR